MIKAAEAVVWVNNNRRARRRAEAEARRKQPRIVYQEPGLDPAIAERLLRHASSMDVVSCNDRDWFATHPHRSYRLRLSTKPERAVQQNDEPDANVSYTLVRQMKPGVRARLHFLTRQPLHHLDDHDDSDCADLFAVLQEKYSEVGKVVDAISSMGK